MRPAGSTSTTSSGPNATPGPAHGQQEGARRTDGEPIDCGLGQLEVEGHMEVDVPRRVAPGRRSAKRYRPGVAADGVVVGRCRGHHVAGIVEQVHGDTVDALDGWGGGIGVGCVEQTVDVGANQT